ncbi:hypothetical protein ACFO1B_17675 [Dactylosporangium siamense]|uniref:Uncharacterized protein n=1 Tax=Dactylosporangium siamense TaxID=685454 RepID=A0A919PKK7_9ACTN|nr:hypothetical protein [Dactylosporangium siamense]GIG45674.1 hypothetical protein Dsi01nite_037150 [Dactylosporangium siamense]
MSDRVTGEEAARILGDVLGREIPYRQLPLDQVRQWAGDEIADMFQRFEDNTDFLDAVALHAAHPEVAPTGPARSTGTASWDALEGAGPAPSSEIVTGWSRR